MSSILNDQELARYLELTLVRGDATGADVAQLCQQAKRLSAAAVVVCSSRVELARTRLENSPVKVSALIGYPFGTGATDAKRYEVEVAVDDGAQELDVVFNLGLLKDGADRQLFRELRDVVEAADERPVKFLLEICRMTPEEISRAVKLVMEAGALGISPGTGFEPGEPSLDDFKHLIAAVGDHVATKAMAQTVTLDRVREWVEAGVHRVGVCQLPESLAAL
ncbi:MAG: deoxyribose-phosphate aldolase [Verrucomicrobiota bacterium]